LLHDHERHAGLAQRRSRPAFVAPDDRDDVEAASL